MPIAVAVPGVSVPEGASVVPPAGAEVAGCPVAGAVLA